jgi:hypothetical protein
MIVYVSMFFTLFELWCRSSQKLSYETQVSEIKIGLKFKKDNPEIEFYIVMI